MTVTIRFFAFDAKLPDAARPFPLADGETVAGLLRAVEARGQEGAFCAATDWPGLPEQVLVAADGRMLRADESLREGQKISLIGQLIGG